MVIKSWIPNLLTLSNLICGTLAIYFLHWGDAQTAAYLILLAAFFDFFDGMAARLLGVSGPLGKQLDSLADVVSFGIAPVFLSLHLIGTLSSMPVSIVDKAIGFAPLFMGAMAAYRLGKFNIDTRQGDGFIGVPTPAIALLWLSLALIDESIGGVGAFDRFYYAALLDSPLALAGCSVICGLLMISPLPMLALKFKNFSLPENVGRYALIVLSLLLLIIFAIKAIPIILLLYISISLIVHLRKKPHGIQS